MRKCFRDPAIQLQSVAARYRTAWRGHACSRRTPLDVTEPSTTSAATPHDEDVGQRMARLEAVLFLAKEPLNARKLSQHADLTDGTEARTLVKRLNKRLDEQQFAFRVEMVAGGYQMLTRPRLGSWLRRLKHMPRALRLSAPAMETLAVVAYRQPVLRVDVEAIRGVNCGEVLRQLMERELVRICGRSEELGRPYLYATTKRFLQTFGLRNLDHLPRAEVLRNKAIPNTTQPEDPISEVSQAANAAEEHAALESESE